MKLNIVKSTKLQKVQNIDIPDRFFNRMSTGIKEIDNLFGSGILPGSTFTLTATPGTGKTTFFLQLLDSMQTNGYECGFVTGEEDVAQIAFTCKRLGLQNVPVCNETDIDEILELTKDLDMLIIDSFPCLTTKQDLNARAKEKYMVERIIDAAVENNCAIGVILHITKGGDYKGSTLIPHAVSANFKLERDEENDEIRIFSASKNRYGRCDNLNIYFGSRGFNFDNIVIGGDNKKESKADRKREQLDTIMGMSDIGGITQKQVIKKLNIDAGKAYLLLKDLTNTDKLIKYGRGENAVWKKIPKEVVEVQ